MLKAILMKNTPIRLKISYRPFIVLGICYVFLLLGCSDEPDLTLEPKEVTEEETTGGDAEVTRKELYEQAFTALQQQFQSPILDEQFETLYRISTSPTYLDFLRNVPPDIPHQDFETFVKNSPPDAKVYTSVLKKHFGRATEEDIIVVHRLHQVFQRARIAIYHGADQLTVEEKILVPAILEEPIFEWALKRVRDDEENFMVFDEDFQRLSRDIEFANIRKINKALKEQRKEQRPDDGFIWLMLREPVLMGEVLESFTDTEIFLRWLKGEFQKPEIRF